MRFAKIFCVVFLFGLANQAIADQVLLKNGDKISGKIIKLADGKLIIAADLAGEVAIALADIATFATDGAIEIHFTDGTVLKQKINMGDSGMIKIEKQGVLEAQSLPLDSIEKINPPKAKWTGSVTAGSTITRGNSKDTSANVDFNAERRTELDRLNFYGGYRGSRVEDRTTGVESTTQRNLFGGMQYDYFISGDLYTYANAQAEKDAVQNIDLRFNTGVGFGYQIFEGESGDFSMEAGVSWFSENFSDTTPDDDFITGRLAWHFLRNFNTAVKFFHDAEWFPSFEGSDDQLVKTQTGLRSTLFENMFAEAKVLWDWDSSPAIGLDRRDVVYVFGLGWSF